MSTFNYYFCHITEHLGEFTCRSSFLMKLPSSSDPLTEIRALMLSWYDDSGVWDDSLDSFVMFSNDLAVSAPEIRDIPESHYDVLSLYLATRYL